MKPSHRNVQKKSVVIVDDHPIVRSGLAQIISRDPDFYVVAEADDALTGLDALRSCKPDIAIIDISLKSTSGIDLIKRAAAEDIKTAMLVISIHDESIYAERALRAGAQGYLMKQESPDKIIQAIRKLCNGEQFVSEAVAARLERHARHDHADGHTSTEGLSDRELEVFRLIGQGFKPKQIAEQLFLSTKTIETHQAKIKDKLGMGNALELAQYAVQWGRHNG